MHTVFALLCFVVVIHWLIFPYPLGLLHWHCGNLTIAPVPAKQPWWIWINTSCEFIMNDCIITTRQSTTKPCAYFLGYTVMPTWLHRHVRIHWRHKTGNNRCYWILYNKGCAYFFIFGEGTNYTYSNRFLSSNLNICKTSCSFALIFVKSVRLLNFSIMLHSSYGKMSFWRNIIVETLRWNSLCT